MFVEAVGLIAAGLFDSNHHGGIHGRVKGGNFFQCLLGVLFLCDMCNHYNGNRAVALTSLLVDDFDADPAFSKNAGYL